MLCQFDKLLYPRIADASTVDYMIAVYRPLEILHDGSGHAMIPSEWPLGQASEARTPV